MLCVVCMPSVMRTFCPVCMVGTGMVCVVCGVCVYIRVPGPLLCQSEQPHTWTMHTIQGMRTTATMHTRKPTGCAWRAWFVSPASSTMILRYGVVCFNFEPKKCFEVPPPLGLCGRSGTSANTVYAIFGHFCYGGVFGDLSDPVVPTLRGTTGDVVTVYTY